MSGTSPPGVGLVALAALALAACGGDEGGGEGGPPTPALPGAPSTEVVRSHDAAYYVEQANIYFDTLDTRADPAIVPVYGETVARWEWPPWLLLTGWGREVMIESTRAALAADGSTVEERDCRAYDEQPFARCTVVFKYEHGDCPIYEEFTFNAAGEMTFIEAWTNLPGMGPIEGAPPWDLDAGDEQGGLQPWRLSTRVPGLGHGDGRIEPASAEMTAAAADDPDLADFARRAQDFFGSWLDAFRDAGADVYAVGCGWKSE